MDASMLYCSKPELMTAEEIEESEFDPSTVRIHVIPRAFMFDMERPKPDAEDRSAFERRPPALGFTVRDIDEMAARYDKVPPVQRRVEFGMLRSMMLQSLISCSGVSNFQGLLDILRAEIKSGFPASVPSWYEYSSVKFGPRRIGYYACDARGCFATESVDCVFSKCGGCGLPKYCSRDCQAADWKARHKLVCKKGSKDARRTLDVATMLERLVANHGN
jgi:hypothetical protein